MKQAIFSSVGNNEKFIDFYHKQLRNCDLFLNFYGSDENIYSMFRAYSKNISRIKTTKFPALKYMYNTSDIDTYDYIFVFDDDCMVEHGNLNMIPPIMKNYNLEIASPCQTTKGKISHNIMKYHFGNHIFRYTNFIEMNFPVFSQQSLKKYMVAYDGKLCGWGNDWWYLNIIDASETKNCGIVDNVCVKNPNKHEKSFSSIDDFMIREDRKLQWKETKTKFTLKEWKHKNIEFVYE